MTQYILKRDALSELKASMDKEYLSPQAKLYDAMTVIGELPSADVVSLEEHEREVNELKDMIEELRGRLT